MISRNFQNLMPRLITLCAQIFLTEFIVTFVAWYAMANGLRDRSGTPLGADFLNVYAAGVMADRGQPQMVYDWAAHHQAQQIIAGYAAPYFAWHYPPMFLAVAGLVALLPYLWAFAVYMAAGLALYVAAMRRIAPRGEAALWAILAFPGAMANISNGQNGFITAGLFGAGLLALEENPWLAGLAFGLLIYKPQFFICIPLMLAVGGYGRALAATVLTAITGAGLAWLAYGAVTWQAFFASAGLTQHHVLEQGSTGWQKIQSVFSLARMWGCGIDAAYAAQGVVAAAALGMAIWVWRRPTPLATRAAALCGAALLTTPYVLDYDLVMLAVPIGFLARQGVEDGFCPYEKTILALLWVLPLLARQIGTHHIILTPFALAALMWICWRRAKNV